MGSTDKGRHASLFLVGLSLLVAGCSTTLVQDNVGRQQNSTTHCSGSEFVDDSSIAVLPIPIVAFFVPHADLHEIKPDGYLNRCGEPARLVNRNVKLNRTACIPAGLTRIITLGVWQWCPANVSWEADVTAP